MIVDSGLSLANELQIITKEEKKQRRQRQKQV